MPITDISHKKIRDMQPKLDCSELSHLALVASVFIKSLFITVDVVAGCLTPSPSTGWPEATSATALVACWRSDA